ncbi:MAG: glycine cleavage system aminomethyltransferase GcvT [Pseudooceanicola nanhaiensis]|uniref:glycine cleavage system aminomethyltransferase GcvT n=1 Tax=Roseovarius indicus TaxID=540747 RepID=UPI0007D91115|nr:glycine cleavage system aminomethyltransferase GcvT [Roseovarius indicus]OAN99751.1 glycine cleavage system protein T [Roseovarius indicus]
MSDLGKTPLYDLHVELGAKMVPFAGYEMPVQYKLGVMKEHIHTREKAGLFDVSHMGQVILRHEGGYGPVAQAMEGLVPVSLLPLGEKRQRYGFFTNAEGGILDDLMMTNRGDHMLVVVNAACKEADIAHMKAGLEGVEVAEQRDRALLALQGPAAEEVLEPVAPGCDIMKFMDTGIFNSDFGELWVSRSGYTGEDGYEISVHATHAEALARHLLAHEAVEPIGLGARDSLRLEGGLCLYGHDIDETTSPVEGNLAWAIQKVRRSGGDRAGGFPGADRVLNELDGGTPRLRVGLAPEGRAPMREGVQLFADEEGGEPVGHVTSGAFGPTVGAPVSMGYVPAELSRPGARLFGEVRGKRLPVRVAELPFVPANFKR